MAKRNAAAVSRRRFLGLSLGALTMGACQHAGFPVAGSSRRVNAVGIQTYTLRDQMRADMPSTLAMIRRAGYDYVELNGRDFADVPVETVAAQVKSAGLYAPSTHLSYGTVRDNTADMINACKALGCEFGIVPWIDESERSLEDWKRHARTLNMAGQAFADHGIQLGYHNHHFEFWDLGGGTQAMQILLEETDPRFVCFQIDIFWAILASVDLPALFRSHPGRFKLSHVKDMTGAPGVLANTTDFAAIVASHMTNVGDGEIDFASLFALNDISGMAYFITEHDNLPAPFEASIKTSHDAVRALRF